MPLYLVTGGAGFIGSHLVEELLKRGQPVRVLDNFFSGKRENLAFVETYHPGREGFQLIEGDLRDREACRQACHGVTYILHQAALRSVPASVKDPLAYHEVNAGGTLNLLLAAREEKVKSVVYAASSSVYGDVPAAPLRESQCPSPLSPYAASKLAGEHYCHVFSRLYGLGTVRLRYFNVFGPRQDPLSQYAAVIPRFITLAMANQPLEIHGDGLQSRDFTYVSNVVQANLLAAEAPGAQGEVINVGCGETHSILELAQLIGRILGKEPHLHHTPSRPGDVRYTKADISQARRLLGPGALPVDFESGLKRTIRYFQGLPPLE